MSLAADGAGHLIKRRVCQRTAMRATYRSHDAGRVGPANGFTVAEAVPLRDVPRSN